MFSYNPQPFVQFFKLVLPLLISFQGLAQKNTAEISLQLSIAEEVKPAHEQDGRLFLYFSATDEFEPRFSSIYTGGIIFAQQISTWEASQQLTLDAEDNWISTAEWGLNNMPYGEYFVQVVWRQNQAYETNSAGNLHSTVQRIELKDNVKIELELSAIIPELSLVEHDLVEVFDYQSKVLSDWWNKPMHIKASVLLPFNYHQQPQQNYVFRYHIGGYGDRYTRVNELVADPLFMKWWTSPEAPQIITVFLDGGGPFGDPYQLDSENNGPYGQALMAELIPSIEQLYSASGKATARYVDGCSTGGWVSLALQLFYPSQFNGCFSYSPDPVDFRFMQLINIYEDENAFYNRAHYLTPSMRDVYGNPQFSVKQEITSENVQGHTYTYLTSGGQWGGWHALFSPKGKDGLPQPLFHPETGMIDHSVAEAWRRYDLLEFLKKNWSRIGPELLGKLYIHTGDMDEFYLNNSIRSLDEYLSKTTAPKSDAILVFSPMKGHCWEYSHRKVLEQIHHKLRSDKNGQ